MASLGSTPQGYNGEELVKAVEELSRQAASSNPPQRCEELDRQIRQEEEDRANLESETAVLVEQLQRISESLERKTEARNEIDKKIQDAEAEFTRTVGSSQALVHGLQEKTVPRVLIPYTAPFRKVEPTYKHPPPAVSLQAKVCQEYRIDNDVLNADSKGLAYRTRQHLEAIAPAEVAGFAKWGDTITALGLEDGWVCVDIDCNTYYLPTHVNGIQVLIPQPPACRASGSDEPGEKAALEGANSAAASVADKGPPEQRRKGVANQEYRIDNDVLNADSKGLAYRTRQHLEAIAPAEVAGFAKWGDTITAHGLEDGWVCVDIDCNTYYLPTHVQGIRVLIPQPPACQASASDEPGEKAALEGANSAMQRYNNELLKTIEKLNRQTASSNLPEKCEELDRQIQQEEEDKANIEKEKAILIEQLQKISEGLERKTEARNEIDKTIQETEAASTPPTAASTPTGFTPKLGRDDREEGQMCCWRRC